MRFATITLAALTALVTASCSSTTVHSDFDHAADFDAYATYAWYTTPNKDARPTTGTNQIVDGRIRTAVAEDLGAKGYSEAPAEGADLLVTYYTSLSSQMRFHTTGWGYGYGWGRGSYWGYGYGYWPGWTTTSVSTYHEGTIIVDIVDREKNQLVWRGVITSALSKKSSTEEKINLSMTRVLAGFPPA